MNSKVIIFEGYDGAGKGTLIRKLIDSLSGKSVRVIGRKNEPRLKPISEIIECANPPFEKQTEVLLRIALEAERLKLVEEYSVCHDFVFLDRGFISAKAWVDYYDLNHSNFVALFQSLERKLEGATLIFCQCDFERCWRRIKRKNEKSKKELLGKKINADWFFKYRAQFREFRKSRYKIVEIDTTGPLRLSVSHALQTILADDG